MESNSSHSDGGLSKWQIAALIGVPVAAVAVTGACVYLWRRSRTQVVEDSLGTHGRPPVENHPIGTATADEEVITATAHEVQESKVTYWFRRVWENLFLSMCSS